MPGLNASDVNVSCLSAAAHGEAHGAGAAELHHDFNLVVLLILSFASIWCAGKAASRLGLPTLVGEILVGVVLGPRLQHVDSTVLKAPNTPSLPAACVSAGTIDFGRHDDLSLLS